MTILLIVGNGLAIDFSNSMVPNDTRLNTSRPLSWKFPIQAAGGKPAFDALRELKVAIDYVQSHSISPLNDFDVIEKINRISANTTEFMPLVELVRASQGKWVGHFQRQEDPLNILGNILQFQLRLYLNAAFLYCNDAYNKINADQWAWNIWFFRHNWSLGVVVSLNYDLILEKNLRFYSKRWLRYALADAINYGYTIPIIKPHGSINFKISERGINYQGNIYESGAIISRNNVPVIVTTDLHSNLLIPDIVLPKEYSDMLNFQHIAAGYRLLEARSESIMECVIVGISYGKPDQPELDYIFKTLRPKTHVTVVDPKPSEELLTALKNRFGNIRTVKSVQELL